MGSCTWTTESQGRSHGGLPLIQENFIITKCSKQCFQFLNQTFFRAILERAPSHPVSALLKNIYHPRAQRLSELSTRNKNWWIQRKHLTVPEKLRQKSPRMLSIFLTSNNEVTYCRLFMKKLHSSPKAYLFHHFLELPIRMLQLFYQNLSLGIPYI